MPLSQDILQRLQLAYGKTVVLGIKPSYEKLLARMGSPHLHLPPTIIVAGTNGKGSTCAFLRAMIEAAGKKVHVFTSPHLVSFYERIRIAGDLITEEELVRLLEEVENRSAPGDVSLFEAITAVGLAAFARCKADAAIMEVGLGGRLDATNIVPDPIASVISRLSFDHRHFLGDTMAQIAYEKAGIMRSGVPCFTSYQPSAEAFASLQQQAAEKGARLFSEQVDWRVEKAQGAFFHFISPARTIENLPMPALEGEHQIHNAGLAIAASATLPFPISDEAMREAMRKVQWPGRLQKITSGTLMKHIPAGSELWLDGGHNDSAGEILAAHMQKWKQESDKPIDLIYGMLSSKRPDEFLAPLLPLIRRVRTLTVNGEVSGFPATDLAAHVRAMGVEDVAACENLDQALISLRMDCSREDLMPSRTLVCGSLYLVGRALRENA